MATSTSHIFDSDISASDTSGTKRLPLVFLADFDDIHEKKLVQHLQPPDAKYKISPWRPSHAFLRSLAARTDRRDSQAILYALAITAYRVGRQGFIVADEATKRRVEGQFVVRAEDKDISVVMVAARPKADGQLRVIAKRVTMKRNEDENTQDSNPGSDNYDVIDLSENLDSFDVVNEETEGPRGEDHPRIFSELGFELHDPDSLPFTPTTTDSFGYERLTAETAEALQENTPLPPELVSEITSRAELDLRLGEPFILPKGLDLELDAPCINILVCFSITKSERQGLQSVIQKAVNTEFDKHASEPSEAVNHTVPKVTLITWDRDHTPSRHDISNIREYLNCPKEDDRRPVNVRPPYILTHPIGSDNVLSSKLLSSRETEYGLAVFWTTLGEIVLQQQASQNNDSELFDILPRAVAGEVEFLPSILVMSNFDKPFYPTPRLGLCVDRGQISTAFFFLTNKLDRNQIEAIYREIAAGDDYYSSEEKVICPIPWKDGDEDAEDGTPEDMYRLYLEYGERCEGSLVFIDRQSADDLNVIVSERRIVESDHSEGQKRLEYATIESPNTMGLFWGRLPGIDAHITWLNLSISNVGFDDLFADTNEIHRFLRPDWPCHDLVDE